MQSWQIWLEYFKELVNLLTGIAWPVAAILIAFLFRSEIKNKLPKITKAGPSGVEFEPSSGAQSTPAPTPDKSVNLAETTPTISEQERRIRINLDNLAQEKREPVLIRQLAINQLAAAFESAYGAIFGSQIEALRQLVSVDSVGFADAVKWFEENVRNKYPEFYKDTTFEAWSAFLVTRGLILITPQSVKITELGKEFLQYIATRNLPITKPY